MAKKKKRPEDEELELDRAYIELTGYDIYKKKKKAGPILVILGLLVLALGGCTLGLPFLLDEPEPTETPIVTTEDPTTQTVGTVSKGVVFGGMDCSDMTESALREALEGMAQTYAKTDMTVRIGTDEYALSPTGLNVQLDTDAALGDILASDGGEIDISAYLSMDTNALSDQVDVWSEQYNTEDTATTYTIEGEMPTLEPTDEEPECQTLIITKGTPAMTMDAAALYDAILAAYRDGSFLAEAAVDCTQTETFDITPVYEQYYIAPVDAVMDMDTFYVSTEVYGYGFDKEAAQAMWDEARYGEEIRIPFFRIVPENTAAELSAILYRDVLGSFSTPHTDDYNRNNNLRVACESLNGIILWPGEVFSYNSALGERTTERGYLPAGTFVGEETVDTVGGGICQVSTTLYYCTLLADLETVYRTCHGYTVSYVPLGLDAMVSWGAYDYRFRNDTDYPIMILANVSGGYVNIQILGTDTRDYYVEMEYYIEATYEYETVYREMYADNEDGWEDGDVIIWPSTGYDVHTYRCRYDKQTHELIEREYESFSNYRTKDMVIAKIIERPES